MLDQPERLYAEIAAAFVRGTLPNLAPDLDAAELIRVGHRHGLKLHRFKRTLELPRVRATIGALRSIAPAELLDIGTGRGVFLWPLLNAFPDLVVTAVEPDPQRRAHLDRVRRGGVERLTIVAGPGEKLAFSSGAFDAVTALEVLEHQADPMPLAREAIRLARRFVIASVPSKPDDNPEHVQLFSAVSLTALLEAAGARSVTTGHVLNHIIAVARTGPS